MDIKKLASAIAKREGKKVQVSIGNIREILAIICDLAAEEFEAGKIETGTLNALTDEANKRILSIRAKQRKEETMAKKKAKKKTAKKTTATKKKTVTKKKTTKKKTATKKKPVKK